MKVLFVSSGLNENYGGPAQSESELVKGLSEAHDVSVLCRESLLNNGFAKARGLPNVFGFTWRDIVRAFFSTGPLPSFFREVSIVHLNGHWRIEYLAFCKFARRAGAKVYLHPRGMMWVGHRKVLLKKLFNALVGQTIVDNASRIFVLSEFEKRHLAPYPRAVAKAALVPNPIAVISRPKSEKKTGLLYFGRLESRKNLVFLLRAYHQYRQQGGTLPLDLVGPVERNYDQFLHREIRRLSLTKVSIKPPVFGEDKWRTIVGAQAVVYPAVEEPFGRVPFEAAMLGVCPVVPDESGAAEYLRPYVEFAVYRHDDAEGLAKVFHYLEKAESPATAMDALSQWIANNLNSRIITNRVLEIYRASDEVMLRSRRTG